MSAVQGKCEPTFQPVKELFENFLASGDECGASITVNIDGEDKVNIWGGHADKNKTRPWKENSITNVWSSSKAVIALSLLILVERGLVDLDTPVSKYWPEFAANGKEGVLVRHLVSHASGVAGWEEPMTVEGLRDWAGAVEKLAQQAPWWTPGTKSGYHAVTMGFLVGELVRRTTGKTYRDFVEDEIAKPLQADFQIGVSTADLPRVGDIVPPNGPRPFMEPGTIRAKALRNPNFALDIANTHLWRSLDLGAGNGHTNSKGISKIMSAISLGGTVDGKKLLSRETVDKLFDEQTNGLDLAAGDHLRWGLGLALTGEGNYLDFLPAGKVAFWGGMGGSMIVVDQDRRMTIAYMMNKMDNVGLCSERAKAYLKAVYEAMADVQR